MRNEVTINRHEITKLELEGLKRCNNDKQKAIKNWNKMEELLELIEETTPLNSPSLAKELRNIKECIMVAQEKTRMLPTYILMK